MEKICNIHYVDAYYIENKTNMLEIAIPRFEAFGFLSEGSKGDIVVKFIDYYPSSTQDVEHIVKGLVIPSDSLLSKYAFANLYVDPALVGNTISITWKDVVYVANDKRDDCSVMYTEGVLKNIGDDHLLIEDPETIRIYPGEVKNHPQNKPAYYVIPKAFIVKIDKISHT